MGSPPASWGHHRRVDHGCRASWFSPVRDAPGEVLLSLRQKHLGPAYPRRRGAHAFRRLGDAVLARIRSLRGRSMVTRTHGLDPLCLPPRLATMPPTTRVQALFAVKLLQGQRS